VRLVLREPPLAHAVERARHGLGQAPHPADHRADVVDGARTGWRQQRALKTQLAPRLPHPALDPNPLLPAEHDRPTRLLTLPLTVEPRQRRIRAVELDAPDRARYGVFGGTDGGTTLPAEAGGPFPCW